MKINVNCTYHIRLDHFGYLEKTLCCFNVARKVPSWKNRQKLGLLLEKKSDLWQHYSCTSLWWNFI